MLWNKLAMPQDTHYQESNAPSAPLRSTGDYGCAQEENNTTTEWPEPRATNCSEFTQMIGMAASPFLVLVSLLRSRQRLSLLALAHVKVLLLACSRQGSHGSMLAFLSLVPIQNSSYKIRNGLGANREPL